MIYSSEGMAVRRVFWLARSLGVWPGYFYSKIAGGWVLTYDPHPDSAADYKGERAAVSRVFWPLFAVSAVFSVLLFAALPFGPDLIYGLIAGSQLGCMVLLARACARVAEVPPPSHPVWRNPQV